MQVFILNTGFPVVISIHLSSFCLLKGNYILIFFLKLKHTLFAYYTAQSQQGNNDYYISLEKESWEMLSGPLSIVNMNENENTCKSFKISIEWKRHISKKHCLLI